MSVDYHHLSEHASPETVRDALRHAAAIAATTGEPVVIAFTEQFPRRDVCRVHLPDGRTFDVPGRKDRAFTVEQVLAAARRSASAGTDVAAMAAEFAKVHLDATPEQVTLLDRLVELATEAATCDHSRRCCREHETHSSPHTGCILR